MKSLYAISKVLRKGEVELIRHYYKRPVNSESKMRLKLFEVVLKSADLTNEAARSKFASEMGASGFSHLKSRLKKDMLNALMWQESSKRFSEGFRAAEFECSKNISQAYVLMLRGALTEGMKLLVKAKTLASKYELVSHRIIMNQIIRRTIHGIKNSNELTKIDSQLRKDIKNLELLNDSEERSFILAAPHFNKNLAAQFRRKGKGLVDSLEINFKESGLSNAGFWYFMAATEYSRIRKDNDEALIYGMEFLNLITDNDALRSNSNIGGVSQTVAMSLMKLHRFKEAEDHLSVSVEKFRSGGMNQLSSLEMLVKAQMAMFDTFRSKATIERGLLHNRVHNSNQLMGRWIYYKACREFMVGNLKESFSILNSNGELLRSKNVLNVHYRIFEILQLVDLKDFEWIEFKLETLRKFLSRNRKISSKRTTGIIKVLYAMHIKGFRYELLPPSTLDVVENLNSDKEGWRWDPLGPELIRFDTWVNRKLG